MNILNKEIIANGLFIRNSLNVQGISSLNMQDAIERIKLIYDLIEFQICEGKLIDVNEFEEIDNLIEISKSSTAMNEKTLHKIIKWADVLNKRVTTEGNSIIFNKCPDDISLPNNRMHPRP